MIYTKEKRANMYVLLAFDESRGLALVSQGEALLSPRTTAMIGTENFEPFSNKRSDDVAKRAHTMFYV